MGNKFNGGVFGNIEFFIAFSGLALFHAPAGRMGIVDAGDQPVAASGFLHVHVHRAGMIVGAVFNGDMIGFWNIFKDKASPGCLAHYLAAAGKGIISIGLLVGEDGHPVGIQHSGAFEFQPGTIRRIFGQCAAGTACSHRKEQCAGSYKGKGFCAFNINSPLNLI